MLAITCVNKHVAKLFHVCVGMHVYSVVTAGVSGYVHLCMCAYSVHMCGCGCGSVGVGMCACVPVYNMYICIHYRHVWDQVLRKGRGTLCRLRQRMTMEKILHTVFSP